MNPFEERLKLKATKPRCEQCHGCENRTVGCRETCSYWIEYEKAYKEWDEKREELVVNLEKHYESNKMNNKLNHIRSDKNARKRIQKRG